jgi:hypothetical protein
MAEKACSTNLSPKSESNSDNGLKSGNHVRGIKLCESTLRLKTRDVYGQTLPKGQWKCTVKYNGLEDLQLDIKTLDHTSYQWSSVPLKKEPCIRSGITKIESDFSVNSESEVKFIISSKSAESEIQYSCDLSPISC